ncbi:MAG: hypothetical protein ACYTXC_15380 [Nostoc sp.]
MENQLQEAVIAGGFHEPTFLKVGFILERHLLYVGEPTHRSSFDLYLMALLVLINKFIIVKIVT